MCRILLRANFILAVVKHSFESERDFIVVLAFVATATVQLKHVHAACDSVAVEYVQGDRHRCMLGGIRDGASDRFGDSFVGITILEVEFIFIDSL